MLQRDNNKYDLCLNKSYPRKRVSSVSSRLDSCFRRNDKRGRNDARLISAVMIGIYFEFCALMFGFICNAYALDLDGVKSSFISGDYKAAISEGENILAKKGNTRFGLDELYYFLGLSYMKTGNYLRAADIFEIIGNEFKKSPFSGEAALALGDTFFLRGDYVKAEKKYQDLSSNNQAIKLKPALYYRLSRSAAKLGNLETEKDYLFKLKQEFPLNLESGFDNEEFAIAAIDATGEYTVQAGSFSNNTNAANLFNELTKKGYPVYIEETGATDTLVYRVKVGKFRALQEAQAQEEKLSKDGYPTKICP